MILEMKEKDAERWPFDESGVWEVTHEDIDCLGVGCGLLGCGGGGDPFQFVELLHSALRGGRSATIVRFETVLESDTEMMDDSKLDSGLSLSLSMNVMIDMIVRRHRCGWRSSGIRDRLYGSTHNVTGEICQF